MGLPQITPYPLPQKTELPAARGGFQLDPGRAALLIHDMQRYFCAPYASGQAPMQDGLAHMRRLLAAARHAGVPVFYTAQKGDQFLPDRGLQAALWGPGMTACPEHEEILPEIAPAAGDIVLVKHRYSAFQRSNLETLMRARGRDQLMIAGLFSHIGCLATASDAFQLDIEPFAVADAQMDFDRARHDMAMRWIADCCGAVVSADDAVAGMGA